KVFVCDCAINTRLLSEVPRDYENVLPPTRDRLYRLMVQSGLFPASPGHVRAGWMLAGAITAIAGLMLPTFAPTWLEIYEPWLRIGAIVSGLVFVGWGWVMQHNTWTAAHSLAQVDAL